MQEILLHFNISFLISNSLDVDDVNEPRAKTTPALPEGFNL